MGNTAELDLKPVIYQELSYSAFERFVKKHYNLIYDWSFVKDQELYNGASGTFIIVKEPVNEGSMFKFIFGKTQEICWMTQTILTDLCNQNLIPEANYLIEVSW